MHSESRKAYLDLAHIYEGAVRRAGEREAKSEARRAAMRSAPEASVPGAIRSRGGSTASLALTINTAFDVVPVERRWVVPPLCHSVAARNLY